MYLQTSYMFLLKPLLRKTAQVHEVSSECESE